MLHRRHYTVEEANAALPLVRTTLERVQEARRGLLRAGFDAGFAASSETSGGGWPGRERAEAALAAAMGFEVLEDLDVVVRDLDGGLIDFPSLRDGEEVYLCWTADEPAVGHWHTVESGYGRRRPLDPWD